MNALAALIAVIACTVAANLLMKTGSGDAPSPVLLGIASWRTAVGLAAFACGGLFYARVLRFLPLNVAQSLGAAQFIAVILASRLVLGELVPLTRWIGISLISVGILIVAWYDA
jgi:multidrug transporter EmrE-like cation transporter